jgi:hypothetical protein
MTVEPYKFLQNIEMKLLGRTAIFAVGMAAFVTCLWIVMKNYSEHPLFSNISSGCLLAAILVFMILGLMGRARPGEDPPKALAIVSPSGTFVVKGISSHKDMVQILKQFAGPGPIPPPVAIVHGKAANEGDRVPLNPDQSNKVVQQIEEGVDRMLAEALDVPVGNAQNQGQPEFGTGSEPSGSTTGKGKNLLET